ncbi:MAG: type pilus assembly protein PilO [Acidobacteriota bacterium]|nr:type pilus assembly protein PilO [Acidobacteriota bacterium]
MAFNTGLEGKPWYYGLAAGVAVGGILFGLGYWQLIMPMDDQIAGQNTKLQELQNKIQEGRTAKAQLPKFREEVRQLELELDKLLRILPARRNTPDLLRRIRSLAEQGDFTLKSFTPGSLSDKDFYSEWPIDIHVEGTYHNLALFFDRISHFSRIINVEDLKIDASEAKGLHTIASNFKAKTFVYKEASEPAKPEAGKGKSSVLAGVPPPGGPDAPPGPPKAKGGPE